MIRTLEVRSSAGHGVLSEHAGLPIEVTCVESFTRHQTGGIISEALTTVILVERMRS